MIACEGLRRSGASWWYIAVVAPSHAVAVREWRASHDAFPPFEDRGPMTDHTRPAPAPVSLTAAFASFTEHWAPRIAGELNGQHVKVVKFQGAFVWHRHEHEDELFLVHRGRFRMEFRDHVVELSAGDFLIVPCGVEHRPVADEEVEVVLFEPAGTVNTGSAGGERTREAVRL